jgi:hypothetical protein
MAKRSKEEFLAALDALGEEEVKARLAAGQYGREYLVMATVWLHDHERSRNRADRNEEIWIARSAADAAWEAARAANRASTIAASALVVAIISSIISSIVSLFH